MIDRMKRKVRGMRLREYTYETGVKILWEEPNYPTPKIMITNYALSLDTNEEKLTVKGNPTKTSVKFENMDDAALLIRYLLECYVYIRRHIELKGITEPHVVGLHREAVKMWLCKIVDDAYDYDLEGDKYGEKQEVTGKTSGRPSS